MGNQILALLEWRLISFCKLSKFNDAEKLIEQTGERYPTLKNWRDKRLLINDNAKLFYGSIFNSGTKLKGATIEAGKVESIKDSNIRVSVVDEDGIISNKNVSLSALSMKEFLTLGEKLEIFKGKQAVVPYHYCIAIGDFVNAKKLAPSQKAAKELEKLIMTCLEQKAHDIMNLHTYGNQKLAISYAKLMKQRYGTLSEFNKLPTEFIYLLDVIEDE